MTGLDYCTQAGAERLAREIRFYWIGQGYGGIETWVERLDGADPNHASPYAVRTNIGPGGFPPRETDKVNQEERAHV